MKNALVIIDMQIGFINNNTKHLPDKISDFIDNNRDKFDIILATQYINHENTPCYIFDGWKDCMEGTDEIKIVSAISSKVDCVIQKDVYSCWCKDLIDKLNNLNIDKVYFVGVNTGCCVLHSAFDAYNSLQDCAVIEDLCGSTSGYDSHKVALQVLRECITKQRVIKSEQFCVED